MKRKTLILATLVPFLCFWFALRAPASWAQDKWQTKRWAGWQFHGENDAVAVFSGSDEFYTNGLRFSWLRNPNVKSNPQWVDRFAEWWCAGKLCPDSRPDVGYGHAVGQNLYTPTTITERQLLLDDRPYAGWLYFSFLVNIRNDTDPDIRKSRPVQNLFELQLGIIGPQAGGEFVQRQFHKLIDDDLPLGWDTQLDTEPGVNLTYLWRKRLGKGFVDLVPHWGASLGNIATYANAGATLRLGKNISDFPDRIIAPTAAGQGREDPRKHEFYVFAAVDGRAVARNIFLDGNTFRDSHSVEKEDLVYDLKGGFSYRYKSCRFSYTFVRRSEEFTPVPVRADNRGRHDFGSINLSYQIWPPRGDGP